MREKKEEPMTTAEAGRLGGEKVLRERGPQFYAEIGQKGGERSWTKNPHHANRPHLTPEEEEREKEIRAKLERGEDLTTEEAGFLGGVKRVRQAMGEG